MIVAGIAIKVAPGKEQAVAGFFERQWRTSVIGTTRGNIALVTEATSSGELEIMANMWLERNADILSVAPVYIGFDDHGENGT